MAEILCVEDSPEYQIMIAQALSGHRVHMVPTLREAIVCLDQGGQDLILLDLSLPDGNGISLLDYLSRQPHLAQVPVIILTQSDEIAHKVAAFSVGVEDYVCKPFHSLELKARVDAKLRKVEQARVKSDQVEIGDLAISVPAQRVTVRHHGIGKDIELTSLEFRILRLLAGRPDYLFSRDQLIEKVWGSGTHISDRTVDTHISRLRKKLLPSSVRIDTVFGEGYRLLPK